SPLHSEKAPRATETWLPDSRKLAWKRNARNGDSVSGVNTLMWTSPKLLRARSLLGFRSTTGTRGSARAGQPDGTRSRRPTWRCRCPVCSWWFGRSELEKPGSGFLHEKHHLETGPCPRP